MLFSCMYCIYKRSTCMRKTCVFNQVVTVEKNIGTSLNENSVFSIDDATATALVEHAHAADAESYLVCGETAKTGSYIKRSKCTLTAHYLYNEVGVF